MHIHNDIPPFFPQDLGGALRAATYVGHEEVTNPALRQVSLLRGFKATEATNTRVVSQKWGDQILDYSPVCMFCPGKQLW